jgi:hypothetical protein
MSFGLLSLLFPKKSTPAAAVPASTPRWPTSALRGLYFVNAWLGSSARAIHLGLERAGREAVVCRTREPLTPGEVLRLHIEDGPLTVAVDAIVHEKRHNGPFDDAHRYLLVLHHVTDYEKTVVASLAARYGTKVA